MKIIIETTAKEAADLMKEMQKIEPATEAELFWLEERAKWLEQMREREKGERHGDE
ncbi:MAG: hypothetical protein IJD13_01245 [Oscillospiraceae bacterium]|nr:hypothetical protein [Oscillospiraceae bacterium]